MPLLFWNPGHPVPHLTKMQLILKLNGSGNFRDGRTESKSPVNVDVAVFIR